MKIIDEQRLESDIAYRYEYLSEFMGFTNQDIASIHRVTSRLLPLVPRLVEATYEKLLSYDATARHFLDRQHGYDGPLPTGLDALNQNNEQVRFRKEHLGRYLTSVLQNPFDARMVKYLDVVGKIHTPKAGNKRIDVPLVQMNALMGLLADILVKAVLGLELERTEEIDAVLAINKLLWIQNDFVNRHYANTEASTSVPPASPPPVTPRSAWK